MRSCTRLIMWWNATRCISVLFEIWSRHLSSCVSIWASFLTKELSRHSLWFSADYWRQKFLQKHHTLHISLSSSMLHSATVFFLSISFIKQVISSFPSNMQECTNISTKVYSRVMLKEYETSPQNLGRFWRSSNKCQFGQFKICSFVFWLLYSIYKDIISISVHH